MKDVILIVEGGGHRFLDAEFRDGIDHFVGKAKARVRAARKRWRTISGYGRDDAYQEFLDRNRTNPHALVLLLLDAEGPLARLDDKWRARSQESARLFFMVQCMEA